jgi:hypothetical protein
MYNTKNFDWEQPTPKRAARLKNRAAFWYADFVSSWSKAKKT